MPDSVALEAKLAALRDQYASQLGGTLGDLNALIEGQGPQIARASLEKLHMQLHRLAGSGGTFGFPELSRQARALEMTAKQWLDAATPPSQAQWEAWTALLSGLHLTLAVPASDAAVVTQSIPLAPRHQDSVSIMLIEDDIDLGKELCRGLSQFGYEVTHFTGFNTAEAAIATKRPDVLIVDIMLPGPPPVDGTHALVPMFERLGMRLPTIFLTSRSDFPAQLAVARTGADAMLIKPADIPTLVSSIEKLIRNRDHSPYRVLIIDDDEVLAEHYRLVLVAAGMLAEKVSKPAEALEAMGNLRPDLVLMDLHMPECSGAELAHVIRYHEGFQSVPIVYLSAEEALDQQIRALGSGADDFLTKPISDVYLVASVRARALRSRVVTELMEQDSLTGLLKHASIKHRLDQEVDRARRHEHPLSVVMLDIDNFKNINDTWGHPMGDQVIKVLGHLLHQRMRREDSIGRYGGEEFAAVLPECTVTDALRLMDDIRQRFSEIGFVHEGKNFNVTFSAGVASTENCATDGASLLAAADAALYVAKRGGRNQVRMIAAGATS